MELGPGPRAGTQGSGLSLQANADVAVLFLCRRAAHLTVGQHLTTAWCCAGDTPPTSLSRASRNRQTTERHRCSCCRVADADFSETIGPALPPAHFPTPLHAPGAAATSTAIPGPRAEGRDRTFATRPQSPDKGHHEGDRSRERMSCRVKPHAARITHGRSGIP
jgi:hypothetical protein